MSLRIAPHPRGRALAGAIAALALVAGGGCFGFDGLPRAVPGDARVDLVASEQALDAAGAQGGPDLGAADLSPPPDIACPVGRGHCTPNPQDVCETDVAANLANCGACGLACSANHVEPACVSGKCTGACVPGFFDCNGNKQGDGCESNPLVDPANCGACGFACSTNNIAAPACTAGACTGACKAGYADCNGNKLTDGCEVHIDADPRNCGECGDACSASHMATLSCGAGLCNGECADGWGDCNGDKRGDGCERFVGGSDPANCGGCGATCSGLNVVIASCSNGVCDSLCKPGYADCNNDKLADGCEAYLVGDVKNCGRCGAACSGANVNGSQCAGGSCTGQCTPGFADCNKNLQGDGCETNPATNVANCGGCGRACSGNNIANPTCAGGMCGGTCGPGYLDCNGNKANDGCEINGATDPRHCGACNNDCTHGPSQACLQGVCGCSSPLDCNAAVADSCTNKQCGCGAGPPCVGPMQQCAAGLCKAAQGQPCIKASDCASQACVMGRCV